MKFCFFGAGAIGGYLAVELAADGHEVCIIARGPHLTAIQERGLKPIIEGPEKVADIAASDDPRVFGPRTASFARSRRTKLTTRPRHSRHCSAQLRCCDSDEWNSVVVFL